MDISKEQLRTLSELAKFLPRRRGGKKTHVDSLRRWSKVGLKGGIKLEVIRVGGVTCSSIESVQRFFDQLTAASSKSRTGDAQGKSYGSDTSAVERALDSLGL
jgi:hypothetical protein